MKKFLLLLFTSLLGTVFCFATPATSTARKFEKKAKIEISVVHIEYANITIMHVSDFNHSEAFRAVLYLNQCRQINTGYNSCYASYTAAPGRSVNGIRLCSRSSI